METLVQDGHMLASVSALHPAAASKRRPPACRCCTLSGRSRLTGQAERISTFRRTEVLKYDRDIFQCPSQQNRTENWDYSELVCNDPAVYSVFSKHYKAALFSLAKEQMAQLRGALLDRQRLPFIAETSCAIFHPVVVRVTGFLNAINPI